jgi:diguanylate cyclase (GGDEF)-like protein
MFEVGKEVRPYYEEGQRRVLYSSRFIGRTLVGAAQNVVDLGHNLLGQESYGDLRKAVNINSVNNCFTRRGMFLALNSLIETEKPEQLLITYVDAVNFKGINDEFGQNTGDLALAMTGWGLREIFRNGDDQKTEPMVGSWGGDEFMCILPVEASMNHEAFSGSLDFKYHQNSRAGLVTWNFRDFLENAQKESEYEESVVIPGGIKKLVNRGVESISYRYTFDVVDVDVDSRAQDIIDHFTENNTVKTATYLRKR